LSIAAVNLYCVNGSARLHIKRDYPNVLKIFLETNYSITR